MRVLKGCVIVLALGPGLFMTFDGLRALILGDYLTPTTGEYAGQLGPWSDVVAAIGIAPRSTLMKVIFVLFGSAWLASIAGFARGTPRSRGMLAALAVATLWYLPVGTFISILVLIGLALLARRAGARAPRAGARSREGP
jgi:hypothetical protein